MRGAVLLIALLACGCEREPSFDERYEQARQKIGKTAGEIDTELQRRQKQAQDPAAPAVVPPADAPAGKTT